MRDRSSSARIVGGPNRVERPDLFPAHPRTRADGGPRDSAHANPVTEPLGYLDFAALARKRTR